MKLKRLQAKQRGPSIARIETLNSRMRIYTIPKETHKLYIALITSAILLVLFFLQRLRYAKNIALMVQLQVLLIFCSLRLVIN